MLNISSLNNGENVVFNTEYNDFAIFFVENRVAFGIEHILTWCKTVVNCQVRLSNSKNKF